MAKKLILSLTFLLFFSFVTAQEAPPDILFFNGKIFTSDAAHPYAQALAIRGERIVAVGGSDRIRSLAGPQTKQVDLGGRAVIPGINDAHNHLDIFPPNRIDLEFKTFDPAWAEVKDAIITATQKSPKGAFIYGEIGPKVFHDVSVDRNSLDKIAPEQPVILQTFTGHAWIMNSVALAKAGVAEGQRDPVGGRYERSADGRLTGVIREYAVLQVNRNLSNSTSETDAVKELRDTFSEAVKWGITSIQDMSNAIEPGKCVALLKEVPTPLRIRVMAMPLTTTNGRDTHEGRSVPRNPAPLITVSGTKWLLDGVPIEFTLEPRDSTMGQGPPPLDFLARRLPPTFSEQEMEAMLHESLQNHDQLMVHISGYPAALAMLNAMQATGGKDIWLGKRVRFEHGDGLFRDLIPRAKEMGVVVVQNPSHLSAGPAFADMFQEAQPLRSLLTAGISVALGSDGPTNPYLNIMFAATDTNRPSEAITREQAVIAYTLTSAYAEFAEKEKGSIEPGKLADVAVLSQDIFTVPVPDLPKTESILTLVGGKVVYDAKILKMN